MAHPQIAVFARLADRGAAPTRTIEGQGTLLGRTMHAIEYDPIHDEIVVPQQFGQAILTFDGAASGETAPIRVVQGSRTGLRSPDRLAIDPVNNEIYVPEADKIMVFPREADGNVAPIRILEGPDTMFNRADAVAIDPVNDLLIVANRGTSSLLIFNRTDRGNRRPTAVISGPKTLLSSTRNVRVYPSRGWILVANDGRQEFGDTDNPNSYVAVFSIHDQGNVSPRWTLGGPYGILQKPRGIALDPENGAVMVSDKRLNAILTFSLPEMFE